MKIVYIIKDISVIGGRERIIIEKSKYLAENDFDVTIICFHIKNYAGADLADLKKNNINLIDFCIPEALFAGFGVLKRIKLFFLLRKKLKTFLSEYSPDFIISLIESCFSVVFFVKATCFKVVEVHGSYEYYANFGKISDVISLLKNIKRRCGLVILKFILSKYDKVVFLSNIALDKWKLMNTVVIPNFYYGEHQYSVSIINNEKCFVSAGRLSPEKGFDILLEVWKLIYEKNKNIKIDVYGEGPEKEKLIEKIKNYDLTSVVRVFPFEDCVYKKFSSYYFYVLPSRFEAFPIVVLESLNNALPVISFSLDCGLKDMVINGENGILIENHNIADMSEQILMVYENPNIRHEMSKKTRALVAPFSKKNVMAKWISFFYEFKK